MAALEVVLSRKAARDIENISDYTLARWRRAQARNYIATLRKDIESLSGLSLRYPVHEVSRLDLRCMSSGHHRVFYQAGEERVLIVRILHERMDVEGQIG